MIRLATIGTSSITQRFVDAVAQVAAQSGGVRVDAVISRDADRGRMFADRLGISRSATSVEELVRAGAIDAVYVASPNGLHAQQAHAAIAAGLHVFLEKPATPTVAEFSDLVRAASSAGVVVFEGMRNVYDPGMARLAEVLPQIGPVRSVSFGLSKYSARYDLVLRGETPNIFDPALVGGSLLDLGVYPLSALIHLFGAPAAVHGSGVKVATGVDGAGAAVLTYPSHVADVSFSKIGRSERPSEIQGERGTLEIDRITKPREIAVTLGGGARSIERVDGAENNMVYEVSRFVELVRGADAARDHERTLAVLRAVEDIRTGFGF